MDNRISTALDLGWTHKIIKPEALLILVTGWRAGTGYTNTVRVIIAPKERPVKFQVLSAKFKGPYEQLE